MHIKKLLKSACANTHNRHFQFLNAHARNKSFTMLKIIKTLVFANALLSNGIRYIIMIKSGKFYVKTISSLS